jgi:hypothetical protein
MLLVHFGFSNNFNLFKKQNQKPVSLGMMTLHSMANWFFNRISVAFLSVYHMQLRSTQ